MESTTGDVRLGDPEARILDEPVRLQDHLARWGMVISLPNVAFGMQRLVWFRMSGQDRLLGTY